MSPGKVEVASLGGAMREKSSGREAPAEREARESAKCNERSPPSIIINILTYAVKGLQNSNTSCPINNVGGDQKKDPQHGSFFLCAFGAPVNV